MGQVLRGSAKMTEAVRRAIQNSPREPEGAGAALRHQPEDRCQMEEMHLGAGFSDRAERPKINGVIAGGRSDHRGLSSPYIPAA